MKLLIILSAFLIIANAKLTGKRIGKVLDEVLEDYDVRVHPNAGVAPTMVTFSAYAIQVGGYCGKNDDMKVDMYFRQYWNDPRLVLPLKTEEKSESIKLGHTFDKSKIWTPDTFFSNARKGDKFHVLNPNYMVKIDANGDVLMSERVQVQAKCGDGSKAWAVGQARTCKIDVESYAFDDSDIDFKWKEDSTIGVGSTLYPFNVTSVSTAIGHEALSMGNYTRVTINFEIMKLAEKIATLNDERRD